MNDTIKSDLRTSPRVNPLIQTGSTDSSEFELFKLPIKRSVVILKD